MNQEHALHREIKAVEALKAGLLAVTDDVEAIRDTIEGESSLREIVAEVIASMEDDDLMVTGLKARIPELQERLRRLEDRIDAKRAMIEQAMSVGEIQSLELAECTVSLRKTSPKLIVKDEAAVPSEFWKPQPPALDRSALLAAVKAGDVAGAELSNGGVSLQIRRK